MPVKHNPTQLWPGSRVPYVILATADTIANPEITTKITNAIGILNNHVGFNLFVPKQTSDIHYVEFEVGSQSESKIGRQTTNTQKILVKSVPAAEFGKPNTVNERGIIHEMCHCLGLEHEHFHPSYPFGNNPNNLHDSIKSKLQFPAQQAPIIIAKRGQCQAVNGSICDFNSIMMYGIWGNINIQGFTKQTTPVNNYMSQADVAALKHLYPAPQTSISHSLSLFPSLESGFNYALADEPILLNGMKVIFDQTATVYPVNLKRKDK
jgi:hypothetical protein